MLVRSFFPVRCTVADQYRTIKGAQVGVGLLGLTFDFNNSHIIAEKGNGKVRITDLRSYSYPNTSLNIPKSSEFSNINEEQYRAQQFGDGGFLNIQRFAG